ncbi:MAG: hypothetical protein AB7Q29_10885 [Vicinamibacterales bacterium]
MRPLLALVAALLCASAAAAIGPEVLQPFRSIPPQIAGRFREARGFQQSATGQYYVFDRRAHMVYGVDQRFEGLWEIVQIGAEPGRVLDPTALAVAPDGSFVVADAPNALARIQVFTPAGFRIAGFAIDQAARPRLMIGNMVTSGIASLQYTGTSILLSQPETGALISEYTVTGQPSRAIGALRRTGHEDDRDIHIALNSGIPLVAPSGGLWFVFQAGLPVFRRYGEGGDLQFERQMQGLELDEVIATLPSTWPRNPLDGELPLIRPTVRAATVDRAGRLWVSFEAGFTYVFDADGDKVAVLRFRGAGEVSPTTLFFGNDNQLLVTPGLHEFVSPF